MKEHLEERRIRMKGRRDKRKQARLARLRRQILRYTLLTALLYVGICGIVRISWQLANPATNIIVCGNQVVQADQVRQVLRASVRKPIYMMNPKEMEARVKALPDVRYAFVRRYLLPQPHVIVNVMEEFPWASLCDGPEALPRAVISETGRFIPVSQFPCIPQPALKVFTGLSTKFAAKDVNLWANWVSYISTQTGHEVAYIDLRNPADIHIQSGEFCLHIGAADSTLSKRLGRLPSIVPVIAGLKENIDYIDLSLDSNVPLKVSKLPRKTETHEVREASVIVPASIAAAATRTL